MLTHFGFPQALAELQALQARLAHPEPVLALIGRRAAARAQQEIKSGKHDPDGQPWAPWAASTRDKRAQKGNIAQGLLWDEGTLLHSIRVQVSASEVLIGTDEEHGRFVQDGTGRMPARAFLGWSDEAERDAERTMIGYLEAWTLL